MNILCTICARGGSKGVPNKNIRSLAGMPLIAHTIKQAFAVDLIGKVVVSTDSANIASIARKYGAEVPFIRPSLLAGDNAAKLPVIQHAVNFYIKELDYRPDYVIDLDPTSPLRNSGDIKRCLDTVMNDPECDSVITGYRSNKNPYFNMVERNQGGYARLSKKTRSTIVRRQDAPLVYAMNASVYAWKTGILLDQVHIISGKVKLIEMPDDRSIDIDSEIDFKLVELILKERRRR